MNFAALCRSCMKELTQNVVEECNDDPMDMFLLCTNIQESDEYDLPKHFCPDCTQQIKTSYMFIRHAQEINETFKKLISESKSLGNDFDIDNNNDDHSFDSKFNIKLEITDGESEKLLFEDTEAKTVLSKMFHEENEVKTRSRILSSNCTALMKLRNNAKKTKFCGHVDFNVDTQKKSEHYKIIEKDKKKDLQTIEDAMDDNTNDTPESYQELENKHLELEDSHVAKLNKNESLDESSEVKLENSIKNYINTETIVPENSIPCPVCKRMYSRNKWLERHIKNKHNNTINQNEIERFKDRNNSEIKNRVPKSCPICNKAFKLQTNIDNHIEREHSKYKQYFCPYCPKVCESQSVLRYHKSKHSEDKRFECNVCGKRFRKRKGLAVHVLTHSDERPFVCDYCHMGFKMKQVLIKHMRMHENNCPYLCDICAKGFKYVYNLREHMSRHTSERAFACGQCPYRAAQRSALARHECNLREHMSRHTGERAFACGQCPYRAAQRSALARHERRHSAARPHVCHQCRTTFKLKQGLNRHMRIHTGEKPYKCPSCPLSFIDHWKRKTHLMRVHQVPFGEIPRLSADGQPITRW